MADRSDLQIRLLGGIGASSGSGKPLDIGPTKCQALLAALALSPRTAIPVSRLVEFVWGEDPPRTAEKTLQTYVARLRKGLGAEIIERVGAAYRLDVPSDAVDVGRFRSLLDAGRIEEAVAEWTGIPLAGLEAEGLKPRVDGLIEDWLGAVEEILQAKIDSHPRDAIAELTELTSDHPFREGLWELLMTALYRAGRQADALGAYQTARSHLVEHLGVEPGARLRELEGLILGQDEQLDSHASSSTAPIPTGTVSFAFVIIADSANLWSAHRGRMAEVMQRFGDLLAAVTRRHDGFLFSTGGDATGAAFHRASHMATWASELRADVATEAWPSGIDVQLQLGLHTGETDERRSDYYGPAVDIAERLADAAHGGQTLLSSITAALLDGHKTTDLGTFHLEGVLGEHQIHQLGLSLHPPIRTVDSRRGNLPVRLGRLIGRGEELETVAASLGSSPLTTLIGPGGIGKTRLAIAAARRTEINMTDGVWLVELAGIPSSDDVARAVADVLGIKESPERTLVESIVIGLRRRQSLIVLDNCEHVIDGAAHLAGELIQGCPDIQLLATSREGLGLRDERLVVVSPLEASGPAVELFNERAHAALGEFDSVSASNEIEEICRRLDGVPLAIELAAARTRSLSPAELVTRLDDRLRLLTGGRRTSVERHRTLRATIQWSYDLLSSSEQSLLQRLSIFAGPFDVHAAETIAMAADATDGGIDRVDVDDLLGGLVDRSMLIVESGPFGRRFRSLETIRQFAAELLLFNGHTDDVAQRHAMWCLDQVGSFHQLLSSWAEIEGVARLNELWPNLRAAVDWACTIENGPLALSLIRPIAAEVFLRSQSEISDWLERILRVTPATDTDAIAFCLTWCAHRHMQLGDSTAYERLITQFGEPDHPLVRYARAVAYDDDHQLAAFAPGAAQAFRDMGDDYLAEVCDFLSCGGLMSIGQFDESTELLESLNARYRQNGPPTFFNFTLLMMGLSAQFQGNHDAAQTYFEESITVEVPRRTPSLSKSIEARAALRRGNTARAFSIMTDFVEELLELESLYGASFACIEFINMMVAINRLPEAAHMLGHVETTGLLQADPAAFRTLINDAVEIIAKRQDPALDALRESGGNLDQREALEYMHSVLVQGDEP